MPILKLLRALIVVHREVPMTWGLGRDSDDLGVGFIDIETFW